MQNNIEFKSRKDIPDKYKWDLTDVFADDSAWKNEFESLKTDIPSISVYEDKLGESAETLYECINLSNTLEKRLSQLMIYVYLARDTDLNEGKYQTMYDKVSKLGSDLAAACAFIVPEIISLPEDKVFSYVSNHEKLKDHEHELKDLFREKAHKLDSEKEKLIAQLSPIFQTTGNTYTILNDADLPFPQIKDEDGELITLSHGRYRAALHSTNRDYRERVYKGIYEPYDKLKNTFSVIFNGRVRSRVINAKIRNYTSTLEAALFPNNIPVAVYDNLIDTVRSNTSQLHRWAKIKKNVLGYKELHPYDSYASIFPKSDKKYSYDESVELVTEALKPLGDEYIDAMKKGFANRWIDVYETKGKRSGAYSNSTGCGPHPFILLNWNGTLDDVFTLVHELGHNMHSYFSEQNQPYHYSGYSIFVAEVASITNEALLLDYMVQNANTNDEKNTLIEHFLMNAQATFYRQTRFAEFERLIHSKAENDEYLDAKSLTEAFAKMYGEYWGEAMTVDYEEGLSWARIPHLFKYNFYVYQYATGFAAAQWLASSIKKEGEPAIKRYLNFLSSGSSDFPLNVLNKAGVDMSQPAPIKAAINEVDKYLKIVESNI